MFGQCLCPWNRGRLCWQQAGENSWEWRQSKEDPQGRRRVVRCLWCEDCMGMAQNSLLSGAVILWQKLNTSHGGFASPPSLPAWLTSFHPVCSLYIYDFPYMYLVKSTFSVPKCIAQHRQCWDDQEIADREKSFFFFCSDNHSERLSAACDLWEELQILLAHP